jgi:hypothetical protein
MRVDILLFRSFIMAEKELLMAYSVLDDGYQNGLVKQIEGENAAAAAEVVSIANPDETYVPVEANVSDPKVFSYALGQDPAILVAKVTTTPGTQPSSCKYTLAAPEAGCGKKWKVLGRDIVLKYNGVEVATNPYAVAQVGNMLYIVDYDSRYIFRLGVNELNGLPQGADHTLVFPPFDPNVVVPPATTAAGLPANAKGQAIIAMKNGNTTSLYALYTDADITVYPPVYNASILIKVAVGPYETLTYTEKVDTLGKNAQEIIVLTTYQGTSELLIPALGGGQVAGSTNLGDSELDRVTPNVSPMSTFVLLKGDATPATPATYDIRAVAGSGRAIDSDYDYILTGSMDAAYKQNWRLYKAYNSDMFSLGGKTISQAVSANLLAEVASGTGSPGDYWDILYETGSAPAGDRLWFLRGSPIYITSAKIYGFPDKTFPAGYAAGAIGGDNVDSATLVSETMKQAALGVSLKRGLRGVTPVTPPEEAEEKK